MRPHPLRCLVQMEGKGCIRSADERRTGEQRRWRKVDGLFDSDAGIERSKGSKRALTIDFLFPNDMARIN